MATPEDESKFTRLIVQDEPGQIITVFIESALLAERPSCIEFIVQQVGTFEIRFDY